MAEKQSPQTCTAIQNTPVGQKDECNNSQQQCSDEKDIFRDTFVRYLGYANEVGEAFRAQVHVNVVRLSYLVASGYVVADSVHKGNVAAQFSYPDQGTKNTRITNAVMDSLIWQGFASVIIPGFTINRVCWACAKMLQGVSTLPAPARKWTTTAIGLVSIPFIVTPIDKSVHFVMNKSVRKWFHTGPVS